MIRTCCINDRCSQWTCEDCRDAGFRGRMGNPWSSERLGDKSSHGRTHCHEIPAMDSQTESRSSSNAPANPQDLEKNYLQPINLTVDGAFTLSSTPV
jgi:hypothetical protein